MGDGTGYNQILCYVPLYHNCFAVTEVLQVDINHCLLVPK